MAVNVRVLYILLTMSCRNLPFFAQVLCQRKPLKVEGTVWPAWTLHWDLPENVTPRGSRTPFCPKASRAARGRPALTGH